MSCPDEETLLALCRGDLGAEARGTVQAHLGACDECRTLVSALARSSLAGSEPPGRGVPTWAGPTALDAPRGPGSSPDAWRPARSASAKATSPLSPGEIVAGKYRVEEVLGSGGMGVVVGAHHLELDRKVALKLLLPAAREVPGAVARFLREGRAAARLRSEHVAQALDAGVLPDGAPYLVLERLEGRDLSAELAARGRIPVPDAVHYVLQAADAVAEAHEAGIVHRDLKPSNLFLTRRRDGSPFVKVLDFGISKVTEASGAMTTSATFLGSPRYMSPEQMVSAKAVDARTDVWALGLVLFELVSGRTPWEADTVQGLCALIMAAPAPRLSALVPGVPPALDAAVGRCLAKRPDDRFPSVAALAAALAPVAPPDARFVVERLARSARPAPPAIPATTARLPSARPEGAAAPAASAPPLPQAPLAPRTPKVRSVAWRLPAGAFACGVLVVGGLVFAATRREDAAGAGGGRPTAATGSTERATGAPPTSGSDVPSPASSAEPSGDAGPGAEPGARPSTTTPAPTAAPGGASRPTRARSPAPAPAPPPGAGKSPAPGLPGAPTAGTDTASPAPTTPSRALSDRK